MSAVAVATCAALLLVLIAQAGAADRAPVSRFGESGQGAGRLARPGGIAVSPDGSRLFIADGENNRIDEYTAEGRFVRAWGWGVLNGTSKLQTCFGPTAAEEAAGEGESKRCRRGQAGQGKGQLNEPTGVAVDAAGNVYAVNRAEGDGRVQKFGTGGEAVTVLETLPAGYGKTGAGEADFTYPLPPTNDVAVGSDGSVYVADNAAGAGRVFIFKPKGKPTSFETGLEEMTAIAFAPGGRLYVGNGSGSVKVFGPTGEPIEEYESPATYGITSIAVEPGSENLLLEQENVEVVGESSTVELVETSPEGALLGTIVVPQVAGSEYPDPNPFGLAIDPVVQFEESEPGAIYVVDRYGDGVNVLAERTPGEPVIDQVAAGQVGTDGANLSTTVDPKGLDTHVYFEYGTTPAYGTTVPLPPGIDVGAGFGDQQTAAHLSGLQPGTTYYYAVVASNSAGTTTSAGGTFSTFAPAGPFALPDARAWEQVTTEKGNNDVESGGVGGAAPSGDAVAFAGGYVLPGSPSGGVGSAYVASRGASGWHMVGVSPPDESSILAPTKIFSRGLDQSASEVAGNRLGPAPAGRNLYLRDTATGAETLLTPYPKPAGVFSLTPLGASDDFSRFFIESQGHLTPDTPETANNSIFEYSGGTLHNIGILPGASSPIAGTVSVPSYYNSVNPISRDGSHVFFITQPAPKTPGEENANQVFVRIDDDRTVEISAPQGEVPDPEASLQNAEFVGASADGSVAFFRSGARLTDDANTGTERQANLYRYDLATGKLADLSVTTDPADAEAGAAVAKVVVSDDGDVAYFVALGDLAPGGETGQPNLYRWSVGGGVRFIAAISPGDQFVEAFSGSAVASSRTTADGSVLVFTSAKALDPRFPGAEGIAEIYRYGAADDSIACVSCARAGSSQEPAEIGHGTFFGSRVLSADGGRVFFETAAPLVGEDTNGKIDVYEWEGGQQYLLSSGTGRLDSTFLDASASGDDAFFVTYAQLVPGDTDEHADVYDARVNGGLPAPGEPSAPCEAEGCRPPLEAAPTGPSVGSRSFNGPANSKRKHHHKKHKRHREHRKHVKHRKHQRSHGRPAVGKRG